MPVFFRGFEEGSDKFYRTGKGETPVLTLNLLTVGHT